MKDKKVDPSEVKVSETMLNNQSKLAAKMFNIGGAKNMSRCKGTMTSRYKPIPIVTGYRKDHKTGFDSILGPPVRQVCRARNAPNAPLGNIICPPIRGASKVLNGRVKSEIGSTEEMKCKFVEANSKI